MFLVLHTFYDTSFLYKPTTLQKKKDKACSTVYPSSL